MQRRKKSIIFFIVILKTYSKSFPIFFILHFICHPNHRFGSSSSSQTSGDFCRICHETDAISPLLTPCMCSGSLRYVHQLCLQKWLTASEMNSCELCKLIDLNLFVQVDLSVKLN